MTIAPEAFAFVRDLVRRESAIVLDTGKEYLVESRLMPLARAAGQTDVNAYVASSRAASTPPPCGRWSRRSPPTRPRGSATAHPFTTLRTDVLPALAAQRPGRALRIWCGACSSGQEPYSVAMTALDTPAMNGFKIEIVATDLNEEMVARARSGRYSQLEVNRGLPATTLVKHFDPRRCATGASPPP